MRQSIIPGLLRSVSYNQNHGVNNIQLYEMGNVFNAAEGRKQPKEHQKLAGVLAGAMGDAAWNAPAVPFDFFDGKGVLESIARELALPRCASRRSRPTKHRICNRAAPRRWHPADRSSAGGRASSAGS